MTLDQLRIFVAVAAARHVTRAARDLNLAQSAVSAAIAALETRHGTKLFHRVGRGIELSPAGAGFVEAARAVLAQARAAEALLGNLGTLGPGGRGVLRVQASQTIAGYWLPRHLVALRRRYPGIAISLTIGNTAQAAQAVDADEVELGFVEGAVARPHLISEVVARDQLVLVVGPEHPWATLPVIAPSALAAADWVLREQGSGTRSAFEESLGGFGLRPADLRVAMELPSNEAVRAAVEAGLGASAISASVAAPSLEAGLLRQVAFTLPERNFYVLRHGQRLQSPAAAAFRALLLPD